MPHDYFHPRPGTYRLLVNALDSHEVPITLGGQTYTRWVFQVVVVDYEVWEMKRWPVSERQASEFFSQALQFGSRMLDITLEVRGEGMSTRRTVTYNAHAPLHADPAEIREQRQRVQRALPPSLPRKIVLNPDSRRRS